MAAGEKSTKMAAVGWAVGALGNGRDWVGRVGIVYVQVRIAGLEDGGAGKAFR